jgi:hypothetical protein
MAKYAITHSCNHTETHQLFGPHKERDRKIAWLQTVVCGKCYAEWRREEESQQPITMTIQTNGMDKDRQGNILAEIVLTGGTIHRKDEIKFLGYRWGEVYGSVMDSLSTNRPCMAWTKMVPLMEISNPDSQVFAQLDAEVKQLDAKVVDGITTLDLATARMQLARQKAIKEATSQIERPVLPSCHPWSKGKWNGKYYGSQRSGFSFYVNDKKYDLSPDEYDQCVRYDLAWKVYEAEVEKIKRKMGNP